MSTRAAAWAVVLAVAPCAWGATPEHPLARLNPAAPAALARGVDGDEARLRTDLAARRTHESMHDVMQGKRPAFAREAREVPRVGF
jgi:hypothetical protein